MTESVINHVTSGKRERPAPQSAGLPRPGANREPPSAASSRADESLVYTLVLSRGTRKGAPPLRRGSRAPERSRNLLAHELKPP